MTTKSGECDVLVVGGGFGGAYAAHELERRLPKDAGLRVVLVAPENFFLFSPLLPETASGTLEPRHAIIPLRELLPRTDVMVAHVTAVDLANKTAEIHDLNGHSHQLHYRTMVWSPGSVPAVLPIPGLVEEAVGFKTLADAIWLRNRVFHQMEAAEEVDDEEERRKLLTFVFVGGGYAGVEALAELESLARDACRIYRTLSIEQMRWVLVDAQPRLLPGLDPRLAQYTLYELRRRNIQVHLKVRMKSCENKRVVLDDPQVRPFDAGTIVWTAGQRPNPMTARIGFPLDDHGRIPVDRYVRVPGFPNHFAVGDSAAVPAPEGGLCPPTAQHAMRQGKLAGRNAAADLGYGHAAPFRYRNRGLSVTLGQHRGTTQVRKLTVTGFLAWWMGRSYHLLMMPGLARRARVVTDWTIALVFPRDVSQLGQLGRPTPLVPEARHEGAPVAPQSPGTTPSTP